MNLSHVKFHFKTRRVKFNVEFIRQAVNFSIEFFSFSIEFSDFSVNYMLHCSMYPRLSSFPSAALITFGSGYPKM